MDLNTYIGNVVIGTIVASLALLAEHYGLKEAPWRLDAPWTYIVGVLTLLSGCAVWAWRQDGAIEPWLAVFAFGIISGGGGFFVILAHWADNGFHFLRLARRDEQRARRALDHALEDTDVWSADDQRRN